jgi:ComEC/Rec2-related protein
MVVAGLCSGIYYGNLRLEPDLKTADLLMLDQSQGTLSGNFTGEYRALKNERISLYFSNALFNTASQTIAFPGRIYCLIKQTDLIPEPEQLYAASGTFRYSPGQTQPIFYAQNLKHLGQRNLLSSIGGKLQRKLRDSLNMVLPRRHAAIVTGFLLGDTSNLERADRKLFRETGISHLLAVSGQHIMVLSVVLAACLHWLCIPPVSRSIIIALFLILYSFATTGSASIVRALVMYITAAIAFHSESFPSPIRIVSIAALLILLYDPNYILSAGFILSFTAVAAIIILRPMFEYYLRLIKLPRIICRYLSVTFAANIGIAPIAAMLFGTFAGAALFVNPLVIWVFSIILPISFLVGLTAAVSPEYGLFLAPGLSLPLDGLLYFLESAHAVPGTFIKLGYVPGLLTALAYAALLLWNGIWNRKVIAAAVHPKEQQKMQIKVSKTAAPEEVSIRKPQLSSSAGSKAYSSIDRFSPDFAGVAGDSANLFKSPELIRSLDAIMISTKRRSLKESRKKYDFPVQLLCLENQNLFHQLSDIDERVAANESYRIIQAQVYLLSLVGREILNRISAHLHPPPDPAEIGIDFVVRDRFLAIAVIASKLLSSSLLTRTGSEELMMLMSRCRSLFSRGHKQLGRMLESQSDEVIQQHFSLRRDLLAWCIEFMEFDTKHKQKGIKDLQ